MLPTCLVRVNFLWCFCFVCFDILTAQLTRPETWRKKKHTQWLQTHRGLPGPKCAWKWRGISLLTRTSSCCWVLCKRTQVMVCRTAHRTSDTQGDSSMCSKGRLTFSAQAPSPQDQRESKFLPHPSLATSTIPAS